MKNICQPLRKSCLFASEEAVIFDRTVTRVAAALKTCFQSVHKGQANVKLPFRFWLKNLAVNKVQATNGKRHDSHFRGITRQAEILYLFDLGYFAFARFETKMGFWFKSIRHSSSIASPALSSLWLLKRPTSLSKPSASHAASTY